MVANSGVSMGERTFDRQAPVRLQSRVLAESPEECRIKLRELADLSISKRFFSVFFGVSSQLKSYVVLLAGVHLATT